MRRGTSEVPIQCTESGGTKAGNGYCPVATPTKKRVDEEEQSGRGLLHSLSQAGIEPKPEGGWASAQPKHSNSTIADELGKARLEKLAETLSVKMQRRRQALGDDLDIEAVPRDDSAVLHEIRSHNFTHCYRDFEAEAMKAKTRQEAKDLHDRLDAEARELKAEGVLLEAEVRNLHAKRSELQSQKQSNSASSDQPVRVGTASSADFGNIAPSAKKKKGARGRYC